MILQHTRSENDVLNKIDFCEWGKTLNSSKVKLIICQGVIDTALVIFIQVNGSKFEYLYVLLI